MAHRSRTKSLGRSLPHSQFEDQTNGPQWLKQSADCLFANTQTAEFARSRDGTSAADLQQRTDRAGVAPLLVIASWAFHHPMSLIFTPLEIAGAALAVLILAMITLDGETTWFEGAELLAVYLIFAISAYFLPSQSP